MDNLQTVLENILIYAAFDKKQMENISWTHFQLAILRKDSFIELARKMAKKSTVTSFANNMM